jgi:DNA-binding MarR family transcriptional regulator
MQDLPADDRDLSLANAVTTFHQAARDLIGVALRSLEEVGEGLSLPKFRMLLTLSELGGAPSGRVAEQLGVGASSVTRMADRLIAEGLVRRAEDARSRRIVALELTVAGHAVVERVLARRQEQLRSVLGGLEPGVLQAATTALRQFSSAAAEFSAAPELAAL